MNTGCRCKKTRTRREGGGGVDREHHSVHGFKAALTSDDDSDIHIFPLQGKQVIGYCGRDSLPGHNGVL